MVDVCLHSVANEYHVFLKKLTFSSFSKLIVVARKTNESIRRLPRPSLANCPKPVIRPFPKKKPIVIAVEKLGL